MSNEIAYATGVPCLPRIPVDSGGADITETTLHAQHANIKGVNGTLQTPRDWSLDFARLDIALSALRDSLQRQVVTVLAHHTDPLAAGATEVDTYTVPAGKNWYLLWADAAANAPGGASGTHAFQVGAPYDGTAPAVSPFVNVGSSKAYNVNITGEVPTFFNSQHALATGAVLKFFYYNTSDAIQNNPRRSKFVYAEEEA